MSFYWDAAIAACLSVASFIGVYALHQHLVFSRESQVLLSQEIPQSVALFSPEGCVGALSVSAEEAPESLSLLGKGELSVLIRQAPLTLNLRLEANFTALGQLTSAIANITGENLDAGVGLLDIDPIRVFAWVRAPGEPLMKQFEIPGPVLLNRNGSLFRFHYVPGMRQNQQGAAFVASTIGARTGLIVRAGPSAIEKCLSKGARLDLDALSDRIQSLAPFAGPFLGK